MGVLRIVGIVLGALVVVVVGYLLYMAYVGNPRVAREIAAEPDGARAGKVMLLTLPSGRSIPVNYWREGDFVYAGADGRWWKELEGEGFPVTVLIRGETLRGRARAVLDDPAYRKRVFAELRPDALPGFGTLVEIRLETAGGS